MYQTDEQLEGPDRVVIGVEGDALTITRNSDYEGRQIITDNRSAMYALELTSEDEVYLSSSVHFADEETSEQWLLDVCKLLSHVDWEAK